jgi:chromate transporter
MPDDTPIPPTPLQRLAEVAGLFLKLGVIAFGGPAAHIAMMRREVVERRRWMDDPRFLDLLGATNLIPGPNSTEMTIHIGYARAGWPGLIAGGTCFILPAMVIVTGIAWAYARFGTLPAARWLLYGVEPVIIAVILQAIWTLGRKAVRGWLTGAVGVAVLAGYFLGVNELILLFGGAALVMLAQNARRIGRANLIGIVGATHGSPLQVMVAAFLAATAAPFSLGVLFLTFLKIGAVLYGSGYVLLAFLQADFVDRLGWLTQAQLIDAVAVGQVTPGPLFTTATFIGFTLAYQAAGGSALAGVAGGLAATLGIFLPSFVFVAISHPLVPRLRESAWASGFLDGANVASVGLMAAVTIQLGRAAFVDPLTVILGLAAAVALVRFEVNSAWLVAAGAGIGAAAGAIRLL